jgi:1-acyl-sn-glycerol-3-phosphate acyltransferase
MIHKILRRLLFPLFKIFWRVKIKGIENLPSSKNYVIISNHLGKVDCFAIATLFKEKIFFMAKKEWFEKKISSWFFKWLGGIPVDRENADITSIKNCFGVLKNNSRLVVFPEGTRNKEQKVDLLPLKGGASLIAYKAKVQIVPIAMKSRFRIFRKNYMYIGKPYDYSELGNAKITPEISQKMHEDMTNALQSCIDEVKIFAQEKRSAKKK